MASDINREFKIWLPRAWTPRYKVEIDGVDVTTNVLSAEFTQGIIGVDSPCKVTLVDPVGDYATLYTGGETIEYFADLVDGTTSRWKGTLDAPRKSFSGLYQMELIGSHYQSDLLDLTVTEEYTAQNADDIYKDIVSKYLPGHTTTNITASTTNLTIKWDNKPIYDCVVDLCEQAGFDAYLDSDKDHHFFEQESIVSSAETMVWNDNIKEIKNLGTDTVEVKNRIIVYGEDEQGLPIVYQVDDIVSQSSAGIGKVTEKVIKDTSVRTYEQAKDLGDGTLAQEKDKANKGEVKTLLMPGINPGDMEWLTQPVQGINDTFRIVKYTHTIPIMETNVIISKENTIPTLFKDRKKSDLAKENITNPFKMTGSLNLPFDLASDYDSGASSTIEISESKLKITSGNASGIMVSKRRTETTDITNTYLRVVGDVLSGAIYAVSANDGGSWETINLEEEYILSAPGRNLRLKITLSNTDTRVDSVSLMYK